MNANVKVRWLKKLRSGEIKQGKGKLRDTADRYCCLGVLCQMAADEGVIAEPILNQIADTGTYGYYDIGPNDGQGYHGSLPMAVQRWAGINTTTPYSHPILESDVPETDAQDLLISLNDTYGWDFNQIADWIEETL